MTVSLTLVVHLELGISSRILKKFEMLVKEDTQLYIKPVEEHILKGFFCPQRHLLGLILDIFYARTPQRPVCEAVSRLFGDLKAGYLKDTFGSQFEQLLLFLT
jgi:hypothetical protein